jgi:hypothetical protein
MVKDTCNNKVRKKKFRAKASAVWLYSGKFINDYACSIFDVRGVA